MFKTGYILDLHTFCFAAIEACTFYVYSFIAVHFFYGGGYVVGNKV